MRTWLVVGALALAGCIEANLRLCDDNETACPVDTVCLATGGCGSLADVAACDGLGDGESCTSGFGAGRCYGGACRASTCGNGEIEGEEVCDDGNLDNGDGCNGVCTSNETCGNGISELLEACDCGDAEHPGGALCGDTINGGAICRTDCTLVRCGNGAIDVMETCDDGNVVSGDGCNATCTSNETCGNHVLDINEQCDDGNVAEGDTCQPTCTTPRCGDAFLDALEICDDGNIIPGDGCSFDCKSDETCGNGIVDFFADEQCDDSANGLLHDGCTDSCLQEPVLWLEATMAPTPLGRHAHAAVYDSTRKSLLVFGGMTGNLLVNSSSNGNGTVSAFDDTWEWDPVALHWLERAGAGPSARFGHAMAYDSARKRVVMFGGYERTSSTTFGSLADTWEWDSIAGEWTRMEPQDSPPARGLHQMTFDTARGRVVMFGGGGTDFGDGSCGNMPTSTFTDTWEWTGTNWVNRTPAGTSPSARTGGALVYDASRNVSVLLHGLGEGALAPPVWEWNGAPTEGVWTPRAAGSPTHYGFAAAYDPVRARVVQFGGENWYQSGCGSASAQGTTYTWNATNDTWTSAVPSPSPASRSFAAGAFLTNIGATVMFGGQTMSVNGGLQSYFSDVWNWNGSAWSAAVAPTPPKLRGAKVAFDAARQQVVLYGGVTGTGTFEVTSSQTWIWDGYTWSQRFPATSPGPRMGHAMAYDATHERVVLYGGGNSSYGSITANNETWEWDGTNWMKKLITAPSARAGHEMVWDAERQVIVMFSGSQYVQAYGLYPPYVDTWTYNGTSWSLASGVGPPGRVNYAMTFDNKRKTVVLHGGTTSIQSGGYRSDIGDTWEWNGTAWSMRSMTGPGNRDQHVMVTDPLKLGVLLFGGNVDGGLSSDYSKELWQWDGDAGTWTLLEMFNPPSARFGHVGVYDGTRHRLVFAFGVGTAGELLDTWALGSQLVGGTAPIDDDCSGASDLDNDGRTGCADPDCWSFCTPECPPMTSCPTMTAPRCGDAVCDEPRENELRCPADCP